MSTKIRNEYFTTTGSVLAAATATQTSGLSVSFEGTINWISLSGPNTGSTYFFEVRDRDGFILLKNRQYTGNDSYLTPVPSSGGIVVFISGAQVGSPSFYHFKLVYS